MNFKKYREKKKLLTDGKIPDKCTLCGLRAQFTAVEAKELKLDNDFNTARQLYNTGIVKDKFTREINMSNGPAAKDFTYYCAISQFKYWKSPKKRCPYWQFRRGTQLTLSDYLSIHHTKTNTKIAKRLGLFGIILTLINIAISVII